MKYRIIYNQTYTHTRTHARTHAHTHTHTHTHTHIYDIYHVIINVIFKSSLFEFYCIVIYLLSYIDILLIACDIYIHKVNSHICNTIIIYRMLKSNLFKFSFTISISYNFITYLQYIYLTVYIFICYIFLNFSLSSLFSFLIFYWCFIL